MSTISKTDATYVMGHPTGEEERLQKLGQLLYPSTRHLFEKAGIAPGMKVLDVGSGAGDVALLLAELVGPHGAIVEVDVYPAVLEAAQIRVRNAGLSNITFVAGDIRNVALDDNFDAIVGRNVLMYVADPAEVLRICANHLRPGGVVAFQEVEWSITERVEGMPEVTPLVQQAATWMIGGFRQAEVEMQMGFKFPGIFLDAGLPLPQISLDGIAGTEADWVGYDFLTDALRDILPKLRQYGILHEELDAATYVKRMRGEIIRQHSLYPMFFMAGAWTHKV
jgi:2-polyprenyl-3-methyl-5-hydroxy-6-metoxy-1,4-benzoquinol methylase